MALAVRCSSSHVTHLGLREWKWFADLDRPTPQLSANLFWPLLRELIQFMAESFQTSEAEEEAWWPKLRQHRLVCWWSCVLWRLSWITGCTHGSCRARWWLSAMPLFGQMKNLHKYLKSSWRFFRLWIDAAARQELGIRFGCLRRGLKLVDLFPCNCRRWQLLDQLLGILLTSSHSFWFWTWLRSVCQQVFIFATRIPQFGSLGLFLCRWKGSLLATRLGEERPLLQLLKQF